MNSIPARYLAYYRVSTSRQGQSGLGLEAQQEAVRSFLRADDELVAEFTEIESGKSKGRPHLAEALDLARKENATLLIAKLDRLARNVAFVANLMESGVDFVAADNPTASRLTIHILAAVAEDEALRISERTKAALAAAKARGVKLGATGKKHGAIMARKNKKRAASFAASLAPIVEEIRKGGSVTARGLAEALNDRGIASARGGRWHAATASRLLLRISRQES